MKLKTEPKYEIKDVKGITLVPVKSIVCITGAKEYVNIFTEDGTKYNQSGCIKIHYKRLKKHHLHIRAGRSHIINPDKVTRTEHSGYVHFGEKIPHIDLCHVALNYLRTLLNTS